MNRRCFDCALCSLHYPSLTDMCELTERVIEDVYGESCDAFAEVDDEEGELR